MTGKIVLRTIAAAATLATVGGIAGLTATAANASSAPQLCRDSDVTVTATTAQDSPSGHHAVVLHYTAANPDTSCTLSGAPYGAAFFDRSGAQVGVTSSVAKGGQDQQVSIDANHSASSYVLIPNSSAPGPAGVTGLRFHLPSDASRTPVGVAWPNSELGGSPQFTDIIQD